MVLQDLLKPKLDIVFCGTAVSKDSALKRAYYAGPGNQFYPVLFKVNLMPTLIEPKDFKKLLNFGLGLTDMVKHTSGNDDVLVDEDFDIRGFKKRILKFQPKLVCFNGKKAAAAYLNTKTKYVSYGFLKQTIGETKLYVAPSTSGSARKFWDEKYWGDLKTLI